MEFYPKRFDEAFILGMNGRYFGTIRFPFRRKRPVFPNHLQSAPVLKVHGKYLPDAFRRIDGAGFERAEEYPDGRHERVGTQEYSLDGARVGPIRRIVGFFPSVQNQRGKISRKVRLIVAPFVNQSFQNGILRIGFGWDQSHVHASERFRVRSGTVGPVIRSERNDFLEVAVDFFEKSGIRVF